MASDPLPSLPHPLGQGPGRGAPSVRRIVLVAVPAAALTLIGAWALTWHMEPARSRAQDSAGTQAPGSLMEEVMLETGDGFVFTETGMFVGPEPAASGPVIPVLGVAVSDLQNTYGAPRSEDRSHRGIDIPAARGTPLLAAVDGWIVAMPNGGAGGRGLFLLDRTGTYLLYYAHLDGYAPDLWPGMAVRQRELLGYVGTSGNAEQPHLHFEVGRVRAPGTLRVEPINPYHFLTQSPAVRASATH
jgi:peptidoglycan LD-endopeptidase LytH